MKNMKTRVYSLALLAALVSPNFAMAQDSVQSEDISIEIETELDKVSAAPAQIQAMPAKTVTATIVQPEPVVIQQVAPQQMPQQIVSQQMPQQTISQQAPQQIVTQPVTVIEASPLTASSAEAIRKNRQDEEMRTETKIVEKLEQSRLEDEKRRASMLFGNKLEGMNNQQATEAAPVQQVQPVQQQVQPVIVLQPQVAPQQVIVEDAPKKEALTKEEVREEIRMTIAEEKANEIADTAFFEKNYVAGMAGMMVVPSMSAVKSDYALGVAFGTERGNLILEAGINFGEANFLGQINNYSYFYNSYAYVDVRQYQGYLASRFLLMDGFVKPSIGGVMAYSYRSYELSDNYAYGNTVDKELATSHTIDLGVNAAVDLALTNSFTLGADIKYLFNLTHSAKGNRGVYGGSIIEKENHFVTGVTAKFLF